ncbi:Gfo/Idh/MocA family protein [Methanocaldococcus sp.]
MTDMVNVAVIGLGYWGPNLVRNFESLENARVVYACDLIDKNLAKIKRNYPNIILTKNYKEILKNKEIDLVCIATPPNTHYKIAKDCLESGKNVLIEKPMTTSVEEGLKLIDIANDYDLKIFVDHTFVFSPPVMKIKEIINYLGKPLYFDSERINLGLLQKDVNVIWDLAPHDFSILSYLFDLKPISLIAIGSKLKHPYLEDLAHIMIKYENNFIAHIHVSWLSPIKVRKIIIGGEKKMILYDDTNFFEKIKLYDKGVDIDLSKEDVFFPTYRSGDIYVPKIENKEPLKIEAEHIVDCLLHNKKPLVDGYAGLNVVKLLEACDKSLKEGKEVELS